MSVRKLLVIIVLVGLLLGVGGLVFWYFTAFQYVTISYQSGQEREVFLYQIPDGTDPHVATSGERDDLLINKVKQTQTIRTEKGGYILYAPESETYAEYEQYFELGGEEKTILVSSILSPERLESLLKKEQATIVEKIMEAYPQAQNGYEIHRGNLHDLGQWYTTTIRQKLVGDEERFNYVDVYRVVLHKDNGWSIAAGPKLTLSKLEYPDVPVYILQEINKQP